MQWRERVADYLLERRKDERRSVLLSTHVEWDGGLLAAVMLNISRSGAMMAAVNGPVAGQGVTLLLDEGRTAGRVIWAEGYRFGLGFTRPLTQSCFEAIVERARYDGRAR